MPSPGQIWLLPCRPGCDTTSFELELACDKMVTDEGHQTTRSISSETKPSARGSGPVGVTTSTGSASTPLRMRGPPTQIPSKRWWCTRTHQSLSKEAVLLSTTHQGEIYPSDGITQLSGYAAPVYTGKSA
jgi:hypothetical protein